MQFADRVFVVTGNRFRVVVGADAHILDALGRLSPRRTTGFVAKQMKSVV